MLKPLLSFMALLALLTSVGFAENQAAEAKKVPSINASLGSCSVEWTVTGPDGKAIYAAKVRVHIAYGFMSIRKMDLEAATNIDGKVRFEGLPHKTKQPLIFSGSKDSLEGSATYDPSTDCHGQHQILFSQAPQ